MRSRGRFGRLRRRRRSVAMADVAYEAECQRAELLGIPKPDYAEFIEKHPQIAEANTPTDETYHQEAELGTEKLGHVSGGLEELSNILQSTHKKINKFRASCGSLTGLLRFKLGGESAGGSRESLQAEETPPVAVEQPETSRIETNGERKSDLARALDNHVDRLDSMIAKAENCEIRMAHQTKSMKKAL